MRSGGSGRPLAPGSPAPSVHGVAPDGSPIAVDADSEGVTLLFLTSECRECQAAWRELSADPRWAVVITPGPETESSRKVNKLSEARRGAEPVLVVMSSPTWHAYGVTKAPWAVHVAAGKVVRSEPLTNESSG